MAEYREARAEEGKRGSYKKLHHIEIEPIKGDKGGFMVSHHYQYNAESGQRNPDRHMFDKEGYAADGGHLMEHLYSHLKVPKPEAKAEEHEGPESEVESASESASVDVKA